MRPKECREGGQSDLFRARLDEIVDLGHSLVRLAATIDWRFLEERFGTVYTDKPGQPPLPTRLMAGLSSLKHAHNLSDEGLCARWSENPHFQPLLRRGILPPHVSFARSGSKRRRELDHAALQFQCEPRWVVCAPYRRRLYPKPKTTVLNTVLKIALERWCWYNILNLLARPKRFELLTPRFVVWCSIQLSYGRFKRRLRSGETRSSKSEGGL